MTGAISRYPQRRIARAPSVSESLFQDAPPTLLRSPSARPNRRCLGRMDRVLSRWHRNYGATGSRHSRSDSSSIRIGPEKDSSDRPQGGVKFDRSRIPASTSLDQDWPGSERSQTIHTHCHECSRNTHKTQNCEGIDRQTQRPSVCLSSLHAHFERRDRASWELRSNRRLSEHRAARPVADAAFDCAFSAWMN